MRIFGWLPRPARCLCPFLLALAFWGGGAPAQAQGRRGDVSVEEYRKQQLYGRNEDGWLPGAKAT